MKRILLSSDCNGNFTSIFNKVKQLNAKGKFDLMLMVGNTCPASHCHEMAKITTKQVEVTIPTYFIDSSDMSASMAEVYPDGHEFAPHFYFLGQRGVRTIEGVKVCYINGWDAQDKGDKLKQGSYHGCYFTDQQCKEITDNHNSVDILLTNEWPLQFHHPSQNPPKSSLISFLCNKLNPRYHIAAGGNSFYRMDPFRNNNNTVTHFLNIAQIPVHGVLPKDKYLFAIQFDPTTIEYAKDDTTNSLLTSSFSSGRRAQMLSDKLHVTAQNLKSSSSSVSKMKPTSLIEFSGFPPQTLDSEITEFLQRWGDLKQIEVFRKPVNKNSKGGLVRFCDLESAQICLKDSGKYTLYQSRIKFKLKEQSDRYRIEDCFLCIGKHNFQNNLLAHIGTLCFISIDKGPIGDSHFQIVPINHVCSLSQLEQQEKQQILNLQNLMLNSTIDLKMTLICYERYINLSPEINHCILHCIVTEMQEDVILNRFYELNRNECYNFVRKQSSRNSQYYIDVSINHHRFRRPMNRNDKNIEIGRKLVCQIVDKPECINWRNCVLGDPKQLEHSKELVHTLLGAHG